VPNKIAVVKNRQQRLFASTHISNSDAKMRTADGKAFRRYSRKQAARKTNMTMDSIIDA